MANGVAALDQMCSGSGLQILDLSIKLPAGTARVTKPRAPTTWASDPDLPCMTTQVTGDQAIRVQIRILINPLPGVGGPPGLVSSGTPP